MACTIRDGRSPTGTPWGKNPTKYEYPDSPYIGARYNSCTGKVVIYYGGYLDEPPGLNFYHLRLTNGEQTRVPPGEARIWTINAPGWPSMGIFTQACKQQFGRPSVCTRWSPTVTVALR
jgi:hypothetical protein